MAAYARRWKHDGALDLMDWFAGAGGSSQGAHAIPGLNVALAANHWDRALESHQLNFPQTDHYQGDIREAPVHHWPVAKIFWASPECPKWSSARGKKRDYHNTQQGELDLKGIPKQRKAEDVRSRALMDEVPQYLEGVQRRGGLVLAGVVENVVECRAWDEWDRWLNDIRKLGYKTRVIALNSMHAQPRSLLRAPQSRDRLYVAYWHRSLGRDPDWDKWLRPTAYCPGCDEIVKAMQVFKKPGKDMGRYGIKHGQYVYRCPKTTCSNRIIEPQVLPAYAAIDWSIPGIPIGDRPNGLKPKTIARIEAGLAKFARPVRIEVPQDVAEACRTVTAAPPMLVPSGGTWRDGATQITEPMPTRTTVETDGLAVPPLLIPSEGRDGKEARPTFVPLRTQTTRNETGLAFFPFMTPVRGGGDAAKARPLTDPVHTVTASGNHHGLVMDAALGAMIMRNNGSKGSGGEHCTAPTEALRTLTTAGHQSLVSWQHLLVPYYGNGTPRTVDEPIGAMTTRDRWALVRSLDDIDINDVLYRMLEPHEIGRAMSFADDYTLVGTKRERVKQYGNAVTPNAAEVILCALTEAVEGIEIDRYTTQADLTTAA